MNKTVDDHSAERERVEVGAGGCGCPITRLVDVVNGELRGDVEDTDRTEHRDGCWDDRRVADLDEARIAAIVEYVSRNLVERGGDPIDTLPAHLRRITLAEIEASFAAYDATPVIDADDGPGRDQHGPHADRVAKLTKDDQDWNGREISLNARLELGRILVEHRSGRIVNTAEAIDRLLTVLAVPADMPPPVEPDLETRVRNLMYEHRQGYTSARTGARQIIRVVREFNPPVSAEGPTVSDADGGCE